MKGSAGTVLHDQDIATAANNAAAEQYLTPNYTVQSPYSTINVSESQFYFSNVKNSNAKPLLIWRYYEVIIMVMKYHTETIYCSYHLH